MSTAVLAKTSSTKPVTGPHPREQVSRQERFLQDNWGLNPKVWTSYLAHGSLPKCLLQRMFWIELFLMSRGHRYRRSLCWAEAEEFLSRTRRGPASPQEAFYNCQVLPSLAADTWGDRKLPPEAAVCAVAEFGGTRWQVVVLSVLRWWRTSCKTRF